MKFDFSFDQRVALKYEKQRAHPPEVSAAIGDTIAATLGAGARVFEVGVGTGRIAWPLVEAGCEVVGLDYSADMLRVVHERRSRHPRLHLLQGDMHALPLAAGSVDAVTAVHVLHLTKDLPGVLRELVRLVRPGGWFIQGADWIDPDSVHGRLQDELRRAAIAMSPDAKPPAAGMSAQQVLAGFGAAETREVVAAEWTTLLSPAARLDTIARREDSESWFLPEAAFQPLLRHLRDYAAQTWHDLDEPLPGRRRFVLKLTRIGV